MREADDREIINPFQERTKTGCFVDCNQHVHYTTEYSCIQSLPKYYCPVNIDLALPHDAKVLLVWADGGKAVHC